MKTLFGRDSSWGEVTPAYLVSLNETFGEGIVTEALQNGYDVAEPVRKPCGWLRSVCETKRLERQAS